MDLLELLVKYRVVLLIANLIVIFAIGIWIYTGRINFPFNLFGLFLAVLNGYFYHWLRKKAE